MKLLRKIKAFFLRTFTTDCPHCFKHFYGTQPYGQHVSIIQEDGKLKNYRYVCHICFSKHKEDKK